MRYGTCKTWAKYFEREKGISISDVTIRKRLLKDGKIGEDGRIGIGRILIGSFYSETDVRKVCAELLQSLPQANKDGFFELNGELYASARTWSIYFKDTEKGIRVNKSTVKNRLKEAGISGITAKDSMGIIYHGTYFPESIVCQICEYLLQKLPQADESGFFEQDGETYASTRTWSKYFEDIKGVTINNQTITKRLKESGITGITARASTGRIWENAYFSKSNVYKACKDLLQKLLQVDKDGFFELNGEIYASAGTWSKYFKDIEEVVISRPLILKRIKESGITGITARASSGRIFANAYFPESAVRQACADLLTKRKT